MLAIRSRVAWTLASSCILYMAVLGCNDDPRVRTASAPAQGSVVSIQPAPAGPTAPQQTSGSGGAVAAPPPSLTPPPMATPAFPSACFQCAPGCQDCGFGCNCNGEDLPEPAPWNPPFGNVGARGFKRSTDPLCVANAMPMGFDVWSDSRGVFALFSGDSSSFSPNPVDAETLVGDEDAGVTAHPQATQGGLITLSPGAITQLWTNQGDGWRLLMNEFNAATNYGLTGAAEGWLAIHDQGPASMFDPNLQGIPQLVTSCTLGILQGGALDCFDLDPVQSMVVVGANLAHAVSGGQRLLSYDGDRWYATAPFLPFPATRLWADTSSVLAVGRNGSAMWLENDAWTVTDTGTIEHFSAVFGTARDDIWAGTQQGTLYHYDGTSWSSRGALGSDSCDTRLPILDIWGSGEQLYVATRAQLARWNGNGFDSLANWTCSPGAEAEHIQGIWGSGPDDVFIGMQDSNLLGTSRCAPVFVVHYDGSEFHVM